MMNIYPEIFVLSSIGMEWSGHNECCYLAFLSKCIPAIPLGSLECSLNLARPLASSVSPPLLQIALLIFGIYFPALGTCVPFQ